MRSSSILRVDQYLNCAPTGLTRTIRTSARLSKLIHGKDDTVVPISQSKRMYKALKKAEKEVMLIELKGEDHWLSTSSTRLQMLKAIEKFLLLHNPV